MEPQSIFLSPLHAGSRQTGYDVCFSEKKGWIFQKLVLFLGLDYVKKGFFGKEVSWPEVRSPGIPGHTHTISKKYFLTFPAFRFLITGMTRSRCTGLCPER